MANLILPTTAVLIVHNVLKKLKSIAGTYTTSFKDRQKALNDRLEWLVALKRDTDRQVSRDVLKDPTNVYQLWVDSVSNIQKEVTSLNEKYGNFKGKKWKIWPKRRLRMKNKRILKKVIKLVEECPERILEDRPERVIRESSAPSFEEYPTLNKALQEIQDLLQSQRVKCVTLHGQERMGKTIIMHKLNDYFYDKADFDVVIFIKVEADDDEKIDLHILQKIAERIKADVEGDESKVAGRIRSVLEDRRYLLILDGVRHLPDRIWEKLGISYQKKDSKVVIATHYPVPLISSMYVEVYKVELEPLSPDEVWKIFQDIVSDKTTQLALPLEGESSSKSTTAMGILASPPEGESSSKSTTTIGKLKNKQDQLVYYLLSLMRIWSSLHLILSYPIRIGHEEFLKQWINDVYKLCFADEDANMDSLKRRVTHVVSESPLRYVQALIPKELINGYSFSTETPFEDVLQPILLLATHLALHQLTQTLTCDTIPYTQLPLEKIQNICFLTRSDAEKRTVVENIQGNFPIRAAFDDLQIIDFNQIDDEAERELELLNLEARLEQTANDRSRHLVVLVDGDGDKKVDPQKLSLPITRESDDVAVFITALSSAQDELSKKVDLTIKTEDHLLPWELFSKIVGSEPLHSSSAIQKVAVQIVEKCQGHLLAIILMAKSLKDVKDVRIWELALEKLRDRDREAIVNAFFNSIWENVIPKRGMIHLLRCLMVFKFQDLIMSDDQLFARWFSQRLADTEEEAKTILQNLVECSVLLQFEGPLGRYILLPQDIKVILHALKEEIPENLSEEALLESTISDHQVLNLSYNHMSNLYAVSTLPQLKELNLDGCTLETLPEAIFKLQKLETLSLAHCWRVLKLPPRIAKLENLRELRLARCQQLKTLPQEIWELHNLETLSLENCWQLLELPSQIAKLENLKELNLAMCGQLKTLPQAICELHKLETLSLEYCWELRELPPQIPNLENLKVLNISGCNRLETLPQEIWDLHKLETLSLENYQDLRELPPQIAKLENLKELKLAGCERLGTLLPGICKLHNLETLSLEHCWELWELPQEIAKLKNLRELRLARCKKLGILPQEMWELPNLQILSLVGTSIVPSMENHELINSDSFGDHGHTGHGIKSTTSSSSMIIERGYTLKLKVDGGLKQFKQLRQRIMQLQVQNIEICDLSGTDIVDLPQVLHFPNLKTLLLGNNPNLIKIPSSFFDHVPLLSVLNLSSTSIHELPSSIFNLQELKEFYLKDCKLFRELPSEIRRLRNLTTLDLDGTLITHLPKEIQWLNKLENLSLTFYNDANHDPSFAVIPVGVLPRLTSLKVLKIGVNSDNEWWFKNSEIILEQIYELGMLQELDLYIPRVDTFTPKKMDLSKFRFIIGHHKPKIISRVPRGIEEMFEKSCHSLKFVNGKDFPNEVKPILHKARAFFLDRHMKINNLSQFGLENLKQVRLCIVAECNEMERIFDVDEDEYLSMKFLTVFYMKTLRSIINKPLLGSTMFYELKLLALHTCPKLITIFTMDFLHSLVNLEEFIVADCPEVRSIITCLPSERITGFFLPKLRKLSLLFVPNLERISSGVCIGRNLEEVGLYYCPKLQIHVPAELSSEKLKVIRAETEWWERQKLPQKFNQIFSPIDDKNLDVFTQLTTYELVSFNEEDDSE